MSSRNSRGNRRGHFRGSRGWTDCVKSAVTKNNRGDAPNNRSINRSTNRASSYVSSDDELFMDEPEEFSDGFIPVSYSRNKRQRVSSGGRSNSDISKELTNFENMSTDEKMTAMFTKLTTTEVKVDSIYCSNLPERLTSAETVIQSNINRIKLLEYKSIDLEARSRRRNLIFRGIDGDQQNENCFEKVRDFIYNKLCIDEDMYLERAHRLGVMNIGRRNKLRPIIVSFRDYYDTELILEQAFRLKGSPYAVSRDYPQEISNARKSLWGQFKDARSSGNNRVQIRYPARLVVNGITVNDCFPDWDNVMKRKRVQIKQAASGSPSYMDTEDNITSQHAQQSVEFSQPLQGTGAPPKQTASNIQTSTRENISRTKHMNNMESLSTLSSQVQSQRTRSQSRTRSRAQPSSQNLTTEASASSHTSNGTRDSRNRNVTHESDTRSGNITDRTSSAHTIDNDNNSNRNDNSGDTTNG